ncbi:hypothetical protein [Sphingobacterium spiritivorum]
MKKKISKAIADTDNGSISAQAIPQSRPRSGSSFTQVDDFLSVIRGLGIPTADGDVLEGQTDSSNAAKIVYNTTLHKLRVYNPANNQWRDAVEADLSDYYTKEQLDNMLTAAKNRSNHTGKQAIGTIEDLQTFLDSKIPLSQKAVSNGVATLDVNAKIPISQVPEALIGSVNYRGNWNPASNTPALSATPESDTKGHYYISSVTGTFNGIEYNNGDWIISNGAVWGKVDNTNKVVSINGKQGAVILDASDVGATPKDSETLQSVVERGASTTRDITLKNPNNNNRMYMGLFGGGAHIFSGENTDLRLGSNDLERVKIKANGFVGIGTDPVYPLDVNGVIAATGGNSTEWNAKAKADGSNATGNWNISANKWRGQDYEGDVGVNSYRFLMGWSPEDNKWHPADKEAVSRFLDIKANSDGSNASGTWPIAIAGNAPIWNGQEYEGYTTVNSYDYLMAWSPDDNKWHPADRDAISRFLDMKANSNGDNAFGTWPIAITGNAPFWAGQKYSSDEVPINNYIMGLGSDGQWHPANRDRLNTFLGSPTTGETFASVAARGNSYWGPITIGYQGVNSNTTKLNIQNFHGKTWSLSSGTNNYDESTFGIYNNPNGDATNLKLAITASGNVGIGEASPQHKLEVNGTIKSNSGLLLSNSSAPTVTGFSIYTNSEAALGFYSNDDGSERMSLTKTGLLSVPGGNSVLWNEAYNKRVWALTGPDADGIGAGNFNNLPKKTFIGSVNETSSSNWWHLINVQHRNGEGDGRQWGGQIRFGMTGHHNDFQFRSFVPNSSDISWTPWKRMWTDADFTAEKINQWNDIYNNGFRKYGAAGGDVANLIGSGGKLFDATGVPSGYNYGTFLNFGLDDYKTMFAGGQNPNGDLYTRTDGYGGIGNWHKIYTSKDFSANDISNWNQAYNSRVDLTSNQTITGLKTFFSGVKTKDPSTATLAGITAENSSGTGYTAMASSGISFRRGNNHFVISPSTNGSDLLINTPTGTTSQSVVRVTVHSGAIDTTNRTVKISGRAYYDGDYSGVLQSSDLVPKKYVDDKMQVLTLRANISAGSAFIDGGIVESGFRYMVQGACLYEVFGVAPEVTYAPEYLSLNNLAVQVPSLTGGNISIRYETTSVDNGKVIEVTILKIKQ